MENLTSREKLLLIMALSYAHSNASDIADSFAPFTDEGREIVGKVSVRGKTANPPSADEFDALCEKLTGEPVADGK